MTLEIIISFNSFQLCTPLGRTYGWNSSIAWNSVHQVFAAPLIIKGPLCDIANINEEIDNTDITAINDNIDKIDITDKSDITDKGDIRNWYYWHIVVLNWESPMPCLCSKFARFITSSQMFKLLLQLSPLNSYLPYLRAFQWGTVWPCT